MTPREAINELKARGAAVRADFDDNADAVDGSAADVVTEIRREMAEQALEMAALDMGIASLEAFGGVDEGALAPAMRTALSQARRDFPAASIVLLGFARIPVAPASQRAGSDSDIFTSPVLRVGRGGAETVAALIRRGFLVWGREA